MINLSNIIIPGLKNAIHNGSFHVTTVTGTLEDHALLSNLDYASSGHTGFASADLVATTSGYLSTRIDNIVVGSVTHNNTLGLQGGTTDEYYHLTAAEYSELQSGYVSDSEMTTISGDIITYVDNHTWTESDITDLQDYVTEAEFTTYSGAIVAQIPTDFYTTGEVDTISGSLQSHITTNTGNISTNTTDIANVSGTLDSHTGNLDIHREINDTGTATTDLWSAYQINQKIIDNVLSNQTTYYPHNDVSDIGSYEDLRATPGTGGTDSDSVVVDSGSGELLIGAYATVSGSPNTTAIPAGTWTMILWADVSATSGGFHYITAKWYKRVQAGTEYFLFEQESPTLTSSSPTKYTVETTVSGILLNDTDRLVVKFYGRSTSITPRTLTFYYEGTDTVTRFNTPVVNESSLDHGELVGLADNDHPQYLLRTDFTTYSGAIVAQIPSLTGYATESYVDNAITTASGDIVSQIPSLTGYATEAYVTTVSGDIVAQIPSLTGYATESYVDTAVSTASGIYWTAGPDLSSQVTCSNKFVEIRTGGATPDNGTVAGYFDSGYFGVYTGTTINEFSIDGTMAGNSDDAVPTEKAVVTYVASQIPSLAGYATESYVDTASGTLQDQIDNFEALPDQSGHAGEYLTTNGSVASWAAVVGSGIGIDAVVDDTAPQLGGDLDLNEFYVELTPAPASDHTGSGDIATMTVDANATGIGAALYIASDGNFEEADASATSTMPCSALALETGTGSKKVLLRGFMRDDTWNWTPGGPIYVSETTGALTQTAPSTSAACVQPVGVATHADRIWFSPVYGYVEVAA